jgi:hypothetical protein
LICDQARQYEPGKEKPPEPPPKPQPRRHRLLLSIAQTGNEQEDVKRINITAETLKSYPGDDDVLLTILSDGLRIGLDWSKVAVNYCQRLHQRLAELVGEENLKVESLPS